MAKRSEVDRKVDQRVFSNTASRIKKINIDPKIMRGGTRL